MSSDEDDRPLGPLGPGSQACWERVLAAGFGPARLAIDRSSRADPSPLAAELARLTRSGRVSPASADHAGRQIGRLLVEHGFTDTDDLRRVVTMLAAEPAGNVGATVREHDGLPQLLGAVAAGHAAAVQRLLLDRQEAIRTAAASARDDAERALRDSEARFRALFRDTAVGIGIGDMNGRILEVNEALQRMLGYPLEEFLTHPIESLARPEDDETIWKDHAALVAGELDAFRAEKPCRHKDGHTVWTNLTVSLVRDAAGLPLFQVAVVEDITERHRLQTELVRQATHDALTGLPNRTLFLERLEAAIIASDPQRRVAVLFVDLDSFKFVNDSRGHVVGDQVLVAAARRLAATADRYGALTARLAGDEFVVLAIGPADSTHPECLADDLLAALDPPIFVDGQQPVRVTASVGVAELPASQASAEDLLRTADLALHAAKEDGKGRVVAHDPARTARQLSRFRIATDLPGAIDCGELTMVYQPLIRLSSGLPHSVEALLRWNHPQLGEVTPDLFVPIAEDTSAIIAIGRWVLERACHDLAASPWPAVNINVSVRQLFSHTMVDDVKRCLHDFRLAPQRLHVEVTESVIMHNAPGPLNVLRQLADLGLRIVMDDFGTGYSNLAALRLLPLHEIKLAGTFLAGLPPDSPADPTDQRILATLVDLAHTLGLVVTAEGVETRAQDARVRAIGCDIGQGHYYAAPGPATGRRPWFHVLE